ncbi:MAG: CPBP family intramembrane metalloprotease [Bacteroidales bacterium]|jgi:membrane protease YdiL (CAAX protease family)|nr:CPBP family intramembrane metalloprotease [Bacteroidales bacterium]
MNNSKNKKYLSISLSFGMAGIDILSILFFTPLIFILPLFMGMELVQLIHYFLTVSSTFFILYFIRKKRTGETSFHFSTPKISILPFIIIGSFAMVYGIMNPFFDLLPMPEIFTGYAEYQSVIENIENQYPSIAGKFSDYIENLTGDYPIGIPTFFSLVVLAPFFEELIYRGIILDGLLKRYSAVTSILISGLIFGLLHLNLVQIIPAFVAGIFIGWVYYKTRNLICTIIIHVCMNLTGFIEGIFFQKFPQYENPIELYGGLGSYIIVMIISILVFVACVFYLRKLFNKQDNLIGKREE